MIFPLCLAGHGQRCLPISHIAYFPRDIWICRNDSCIFSVGGMHCSGLCSHWSRQAMGDFQVRLIQISPLPTSNKSQHCYNLVCSAGIEGWCALVGDEYAVANWILVSFFILLLICIVLTAYFVIRVVVKYDQMKMGPQYVEVKRVVSTQDNLESSISDRFMPFYSLVFPFSRRVSLYILPVSRRFPLYIARFKSLFMN